MAVDWPRLLAIAVEHIQSLAKQDIPVEVPNWTFGGGTALMIWMDHRDSRDIDIFLDDPQYLTMLSPRLCEMAVEAPLAYQESTNFLKLDYPSGEIDFIVAGLQTDDPFVRRTVAGMEVNLETPVEIAVKKLVYRGSDIKPRDIFDIAVIAEKHSDILRKELSMRPDVKAKTLERLDRLKAGFVEKYLDDLNIHPNWEWIKPTVGDRVRELLES